jgi:hypothetical protein
MQADAAPRRGLIRVVGVLHGLTKQLTPEVLAEAVALIGQLRRGLQFRHF